jgi:hypothetical protein
VSRHTPLRRDEAQADTARERPGPLREVRFFGKLEAHGFTVQNLKGDLEDPDAAAKGRVLG